MENTFFLAIRSPMSSEALLGADWASRSKTLA